MGFYKPPERDDYLHRMVMQTHYLLQGLKNNDLEEKKGFPEIILLKINSP